MTFYDSRVCEELKAHCKKGKSLESFCALIGISPRVMTEWYHSYPEFQETVEMAPCLELLYWEEVLASALETKDKDYMSTARYKIEYLSKFVTSPIKKDTFNDLRDVNSKKQNKTSGDLVKDFALLRIK